jgi:hypothetical protein
MGEECVILTGQCETAVCDSVVYQVPSPVTALLLYRRIRKHNKQYSFTVA